MTNYLLFISKFISITSNYISIISLLVLYYPRGLKFNLLGLIIYYLLISLLVLLVIISVLLVY